MAAALRDIDTALGKITWQRGQQPGVHTADVRAVNAAIEAAARTMAAQ